MAKTVVELYLLKFHLIFFCFIVSTKSAKYTIPTDYCKVPTRLELVFLVDNSDPYPVEKIKDIVPIADELLIKYPGSKFGLALFSDFECTAWTAPKLCVGSASFHHQDPNACYKFEEELTTELGRIKERVSEKIEIKYSNASDAGINGLLLTGAETQMGWTRGKDQGGLVRLIVVVTDDATHDGGPFHGTHDGKKRMPVRGDGTDKCETMFGATAQDANKVLGNDQISVYVLVHARIQSAWNTWRDKLGSMVDVRFRMQSAEDGKDEILKGMSHFIDQLSADVGKVDCSRCCVVT